MNKTMMVRIGFMAIFLFAGCTDIQPSVQSSKKIVFKDGKPYAIPSNTAIVAKIKNKKDIQNAKKIGAYCKKGDIVWAHQNMGTMLDKYDAETLRAKLRKNHLAGCASPLSEQEYQYRMVEKQQKYRAEQASKARAQKSFDRTMDRNQRHNEAMLNSMRPQIVLPNVYSY